MNPLIREIKEQLLPAYSPDEAEALAWWVAEECTGLTRTQLLLNEISNNSSDKIKNINYQLSIVNCIARLLRHEPIQYIFGYTLWRGLRLSVTPATLIPRPETAELVDLVLNEISTINYQLSTVLDACTGSGCIAIALKQAHPEWQIDACDLSEEALQIARQNALDNGTDIRFFCHDLLSPFNFHLSTRYDLVVSNPPYVKQSERKDMEQRVLDYEPASALFVPDNDPLIFYRALVALQAPILAVEINEALSRETAQLFRDNRYTDTQIFPDSYGKPRFIIGRMA